MTPTEMQEQLRGEMRSLETACALLIQQPVEALRGVADLAQRISRLEARVKTLESDLRSAKRQTDYAVPSIDGGGA